MRSFPKMSQGYMDWVIIKPEHVKQLREQYATRKEPWTWKEIESDFRRMTAQRVSETKK
jgi:hypothetical protein